MAANGVEISSAYLSLLVKMPGVAKSMNAALGRVDVSPAAKKIGQQVSASIGKSLKSKVVAQLADASAAALDKSAAATKRLTNAEHDLAKVRAQHGTNKAKVTAAEERLEKLRKSGTATTGDLEKAEAALTKAETAAASTRRDVESATNSVAAAKRDSAKASEEYSAALKREKSAGEKALAWMPLADARIDAVATKWEDAGKRIGGIGDSLTNNITKPAVVASGAVASIVGALGFKRLVGIDTARGQFKGLGLDADAVMKQVDAGVTNTALSMADGAALAVGILATGNLPLSKLEEQLKRVANVSAAYNVESSHAGYLLNNVLTKNKVTYGDLSQMVQNNIPIISELGKHYGVAGDEIAKMAQRGEISVEDFNNVIDGAAGTAALEYANTWKGVTSNILSNLGKIGAKFLEPTFNIMKDEAAGFLDLLKSPEFATAATQLGTVVGQIVRDVSDRVRELIGWWGGLSASQQSLIGKAVLLAVALGPVLKIVGLLVGGIGSMIRVGQVLVGVYTGWTAAAKLAEGATTGQTIALKIQEGASNRSIAGMKTGIAVQRVWNAVMNANPIGLIVTAIAALVAGLVWFFTKTKLGQEIWSNFTRFLGEAWTNVSNLFSQIWANSLKPVFDGIGQVATWVFENILKPAFDGAVAAFTWIGSVFSAIWTGFLKPVFDGIARVATWVFQNILFPIFKIAQLAFAVFAGVLVGVWESILQPIFVAIGAVFTWLWETVISVVVAYIQVQIRAWGAIFTWLWTVILQPVFAKIGEIFGWIYNNIIRPIVLGIQIYIKIWGAIFTWLYQTVIQPIFDAIGRIFNWILNSIIKPIVSQIQTNIRAAGAVFTWLYQNAIKPAWDAISAVISNVWTKGIKPVIDTLSKVIRSDPKAAFEAARDAVGKAWDGIRDMARKPVKFVVETVLGGLIDVVNGFGLKLPKPKLPKGFAGGGVLPGYMSAKRDDVLMPMRSGEGVLVPEVVRGLGPGFVHALNAAGNSGGVSAVRSRFGHIGAGLARGGLVDPLPKGSWYQSQPWGSAHNGMDMAAPSGTKVYAATSGIVRLAGVVPMGGNEIYVQGANGIGTRYSHLSRFATKVGASVRQGQVIGYVGSTGMSTGPHLHYMVHNPGLGAGSYYPNVNPAAYIGTQGKEVAAGTGLFDGLIDGAVAQIKKAFPGGGFFVDMAGGVAKHSLKGLTNVFTGMFGADTGSTGAKLYDQGGIIPHRGVGVNLSGKPEAVLTNEEARGYKMMMRALSGAGGLSGVGGNVLAGLVAGLHGGHSGVESAVREVTSVVIGTANKELEIHSPSRVFRTIGKYIGAGLNAGINGSVAATRTATERLVRSVVSGFDQLGGERSTLQKKLDKALGNWRTSKAGTKAKANYAAQIADYRKQIGAINATIGAPGRSKEPALLKSLAAQNAKLNSLAFTRAQVAKKLTAAQKSLAEASDQMADWSAGIQDKINGLGGIAGKSSVTSMVSNLNKRLAATKAFTSTIAKLKKLGLDSGSLQELTEAFAQSGSSKAADALLASGKGGVKQVVDLRKQLDAAGGKLGDQVGVVLYQAGVDSAKGLIKGLQSQEKALQAQAKKIANTITATVKKTLGIKSPSRVLAKLGSWTGEGFARGIESTFAVVARAAEQMVQMPAALTPDFELAGVRAIPPRFSAEEFRGAGSSAAVFPESFILRVGQREFDAYVEEISGEVTDRKLSPARRGRARQHMGTRF